MEEQIRTLQEEGWTLLRMTETGKAVMQAPDHWSSGGYTIHIVVSDKGIVGRYTSHHTTKRNTEKP